MGVALATPRTTIGQPNPINVSAPSASVAAPAAATPDPGSPIKVSSLTDIKGPRTDALAQALIEGSNTKPRSALETLGNLGQFWAGTGEQREYETRAAKEAQLPTTQIQEFVAGGGDLSDPEAMIATGAEPLVKMGADILSTRAKATAEAAAKPPEREKDGAGNIIERQADGTWAKVYNAEKGIRAATPEERAATPGADWSRLGISVATGELVEFPATPDATTEPAKILQDAARGLYGTGPAAEAIVDTLMTKALQNWRIITPEEIQKKIPGFVPKPGVIYQQSPTGQIDATGTGGTEIVMPGEPGSDAEILKSLSVEEGKEYGDVLRLGRTSSALNQNLEVMGQLANIAPSGPIAGQMAAWFPNFSTAGAAFNALIKEAAPKLRVEGSGSTSDIEYQGMIDAFPKLQNTALANQIIIKTMQAKGAINMERADLVRQWRRGRLTLEEFDAKYAELDQRSLMTDELKALIYQAQGSNVITRPELLSEEGVTPEGAAAGAAGTGPQIQLPEGGLKPGVTYTFDPEAGSLTAVPTE